MIQKNKNLRVNLGAYLGTSKGKETDELRCRIADNMLNAYQKCSFDGRTQLSEVPKTI